MRRLKVLITGIGSGIGVSILKSIRISNLNAEIIGTDMKAFNPGGFLCDRTYVISSALDDKYLEDIISICNKENIDIVIPGTDTELQKLSALKEMKIIKSFILVGSEDSIKICRDKRKSYEFFSKFNLPFVKTAKYNDIKILLDEVGFPLIAKPVSGSGSNDVQIILNKEDLDNLDNKKRYIFQEYLISSNWNLSKETISKEDIMEGKNIIQKDEISIQLLIGHEKEILSTFMSINELKFGMPMNIVPFYNKNFEEIAVKIGEKLAEVGLIGSCNIQCKVTNKGLVAFEINPRFTGITSVRASLNFNECEALIRYYFFHEPVEKIKEILKINYDYVCCRYLNEVKYKKESLNFLETNKYIYNG